MKGGPDAPGACAHEQTENSTPTNKLGVLDERWKVGRMLLLLVHLCKTENSSK